MTDYRIYIDEVGNSDLGSAENPNHRFLSLTGIIFAHDYIKTTVHPQLESMKSEFFSSHPDEPVIFHRKEMLNAKYPFHVLRDSVKRSEFNDRLLACLHKWEYTVITVVIDKLDHKKQYSVWKYDPYHYCLAVMLERYLFFLQQRSSHGDALAESRGGKEDIRLKNSFTGLWENGTQFVEGSQFQQFLTSRKLKIKPKINNIAGLQVADLVAHPSRREILLESGKIQDERESIFGDEICKILRDKYYQPYGRIYGYGKKILP